jgi:hypothetical protein
MSPINPRMDELKLTHSKVEEPQGTSIINQFIDEKASKPNLL